MSSTRVTSVTGPGGAAASVRRVRHQARDALAVMTFSLVTSASIALALLVLTVMLHPGR